MSNILSKHEHESELQYHKRLLEGKLVDKSLSDYDYSELSSYLYNKPYSADVARRMAYGSLYTLGLIHDAIEYNNYNTDTPSQITEDLLKLSMEKKKISHLKTALNRKINEQAWREQLLEIVEDSISKTASKEMLSPVRQTSSMQDECNEGKTFLVSLNDLHVGMDVSNYWNTYNTEILQRRLDFYLKKIIELHDKEKAEQVIVWCAGDLINGRIYPTVSMENNEDIIVQITTAAQIIYDFLQILSYYLPLVQFVCVSGNHSRVTANKSESLKDERLDRLIPWYLKAKIKANNKDNVIIIDQYIDESIGEFTLYGEKYLVTHGDYERSGNKIKDLADLYGKDQSIYAVLSGHTHQNQISVINGIHVITGGSPVGLNDYCIENRLSGKPESLITLVKHDQGIYCHYPIQFE